MIILFESNNHLHFFTYFTQYFLGVMNIMFEILHEPGIHWLEICLCLFGKIVEFFQLHYFIFDFDFEANYF